MVGTDTLTMIAFGSTTLLTLGVLTAVREIFSPKEIITESGKRIRGSLRRTATVFDQAPARGLFGRIDQGFDQLILESGFEMAPAAAFQWLIIFALLGGGGAYLVNGDPLVGVAGALAGMVLMLLIFTIRRARRLAAIREQLPHVLEMLARGTRAGQSTEQAIALVGEEAGGILGKEFKRCTQQLEMGRAFDRVLASLASRVRLVDIRILTTTLIVQRQAGGHLSETLDRMAMVVRDRLTAARQMKASTGGGRMSTMIVAGIAPFATIAIYMLHREHFTLLFEDSLGRTLLMTGIVLELIGLVWVYTLLRQDN
ncbi:MAG TPA: type II secretion system F family protein [Planctomicrobium sp.]|nr:type II secretion system F family protein [Planctomicrobium sp.]